MLMWVLLLLFCDKLLLTVSLEHSPSWEGIRYLTMQFSQFFILAHSLRSKHSSSHSVRRCSLDETSYTTCEIVCIFIFTFVDKKHKDKSCCSEQEPAFSEYKNLCNTGNVCPSHMTCELSEKGPIRTRKKCSYYFFVSVLKLIVYII